MAMDSLLKSRIWTVTPDSRSMPRSPLAALTRAERRLLGLIEPETLTILLSSVRGPDLLVVPPRRVSDTVSLPVDEFQIRRKAFADDLAR